MVEGDIRVPLLELKHEYFQIVGLSHKIDVEYCHDLTEVEIVELVVDEE